MEASAGPVDMNVKKLPTPNQLLMNKNLLKRITSLGLESRRALLATAAWLLCLSATYAQTSVSGRITSGEDASPLPGVNILVKGTADGTISDADGKFFMNVPSNESV